MLDDNTISKRTLKEMDEAVKNLKSDKTSNAIDLSDFEGKSQSEGKQ